MSISKEARVYSREFRMQVVRRLLDGEKVRTVSEELGIHRKLLYQWLRQVNEGGAENLRPRGRPRKPGGLTGAPRLEAAGEMERTIARQRAAIEFLRAVTGTLQRLAQPRQAGRDAIYAAVQELVERDEGLPAQTLCELAGLSRCGYYRYLRARGGGERGNIDS